jgi:drug/metabolite transporter (DMT)-like permease
VNQSSNTTKAVVYMLLGMLIIPLIDVFAKFLGQQGLHLVQLVWARLFFGALVALPFVMKRPETINVWSASPILQFARAGFLVGGTGLFFSGLKYLPIADTLALYFVQPILVTALSPLLLGERVDFKRWAMVFLGFVGVLIIVRPGFKEINPGVLLALLSGLCAACYVIITRLMANTVDALTTNFQTCLIGAVPLTAALPFFWLTPNVSQFAMLLGIGAVAMLSHYLATRAYTLAEASLISPLAYTEMINAVFLGWLFFNDFPDRYTFLGVGVLITCAIFVSSTGRGTRSTKDNGAVRTSIASE